jgi:hypothetical protein
VDVPTGHPGLEADAAETLLTGQAVDAALPGAEGAKLQQSVGPFNAAGQLASVVEFKIGGEYTFFTHVIHNR